MRETTDKMTTCRPLTWASLLFVLCLGAACDDAISMDGTLERDQDVCEEHNDLAHAALTGEPRRVLVFVDQSSSATGDTLVTQDYLEAFKHRVSEDLLANGSSLEVFLVHSRTTGRAGALRFAQEVAPPEEKSLVLEMKKACGLYAAQVARTMKSAWESGRERIENRFVGRENQQATDLWGVLEVASIAFGRDSTKADRSVFVYSDMLECVAGRTRRCFERRPPASKAEAEAWAATDATTITSELSVEPAALADVHFTFVMGRHALRQDTANVPYYWRALLQHLGVAADHIAFL